jgi:hypothetical protein
MKGIVTDMNPDVEALERVLKFAKDNGLNIGHVRVGSISLRLKEPVPTEAEKLKAEQAKPSPKRVAPTLGDLRARALAEYQALEGEEGN